MRFALDLSIIFKIYDGGDLDENGFALDFFYGAILMKIAVFL